MSKDIKCFIIDAIGYIVTLSVIFYFIILTLYSINNINETLKETFSLTLNFFSALTTITTAIIAAKLFNHWKDSQTGLNRSDLCKNILSDLIELKDHCDYKTTQLKLDLFFEKNNQNNSKEYINQKKEFYIDSKINFQQKYMDISKSLFLNLKIYENSFDKEIINKNEIGLFHYYQINIISLMSKFSENESYNELNLKYNILIDSKHTFERDYYNAIIYETKKYINFTDNS